MTLYSIDHNSDGALVFNKTLKGIKTGVVKEGSFFGKKIKLNGLDRNSNQTKEISFDRKSIIEAIKFERKLITSVIDRCLKIKDERVSLINIGLLHEINNEKFNENSDDDLNSRIKSILEKLQIIKVQIERAEEKGTQEVIQAIIDMKNDIDMNKNGDSSVFINSNQSFQKLNQMISSKKIFWLENLAKVGNKDAQYYFGLFLEIYSQSSHLDKKTQDEEKDKAKEFFLRAAQQGDSRALYQLAKCHQPSKKNLFFFINPPTYLQQAADLNHPMARLEIYEQKMKNEKRISKEKLQEIAGFCQECCNSQRAAEINSNTLKGEIPSRERALNLFNWSQFQLYLLSFDTKECEHYRAKALEYADNKPEILSKIAEHARKVPYGKANEVYSKILKSNANKNLKFDALLYLMDYYEYSFNAQGLFECLASPDFDSRFESAFLHDLIKIYNNSGKRNLDDEEIKMRQLIEIGNTTKRPRLKEKALFHLFDVYCKKDELKQAIQVYQELKKIVKKPNKLFHSISSAELDEKKWKLSKIISQKAKEEDTIENLKFLRSQWNDFMPNTQKNQKLLEMLEQKIGKLLIDSLSKTQPTIVPVSSAPPLDAAPILDESSKRNLQLEVESPPSSLYPKLNEPTKNANQDFVNTANEDERLQILKLKIDSARNSEDKGKKIKMEELESFSLSDEENDAEVEKLLESFSTKVNVYKSLFEELEKIDFSQKVTNLQLLERGKKALQQLNSDPFVGQFDLNSFVLFFPGLKLLIECERIYTNMH